MKRITIVFDEGQDESGGPDFFGAAVLDNIDVNGVLVGRQGSAPAAAAAAVVVAMVMTTTTTTAISSAAVRGPDGGTWRLSASG